MFLYIASHANLRILYLLIRTMHIREYSLVYVLYLFDILAPYVSFSIMELEGVRHNPRHLKGDEFIFNMGFKVILEKWKVNSSLYI